MSDPASREEFNTLFHANTRIEGYGAGTQTVAPCPFCAAPDWAIWNIYEMARDDNAPMRRDRTCASCGRSAKMEITRPESGGVVAELVQTGGADPPAWMEPWPRRVAA